MSCLIRFIFFNRCVLTGKCNVPDCEYGVYDPEKGRCPKRPDHLGSKDGEGLRRPIPNHKNPNHRWIYFERDWNTSCGCQIDVCHPYCEKCHRY